VEYGQILEMARARQEEAAFAKPRRAMLNLMVNGRLSPAMRLMPGRRMPATISHMVSGQAPEADLPVVSRRAWPPLEDLPEVQGEVYLLEGCVAGATFPSVQEATRRLLRRAGFAVRELRGCCGALHAHAGLESKDGLLRGRLHADLPLVTNTAGCGSHLKACGVEGVFDISEFLADCGFEALLRSSPGLGGVKATYHDACHLAHGQRLTAPPRVLLGAVPGLSLTHLREADVCCGSGGVYNLFQPEMARRLLDRKWANIEATEASLVVLGNQGCQAWIAQAAREHGGDVQVMHTVEVLEAAFSGMPR
jgi:glycolate oxidase iron-sulfur subunit